MANSTGSRSVSKRFKWSVDLSNRNRTACDLASPPGYNPSVATTVAESARETDSSLITKRSWDVALQPLKQTPMQLFMMYMVGNSISIFPIMMVGMMFVRPLRALFSLNQAFKMLDSTQGFAAQKFVFLLGQLVGLGLALYKCQSMGLLPTHSSDWLAFIEPQQRIEFSGGGQLLL